MRNAWLFSIALAACSTPGSGGGDPGGDGGPAADAAVPGDWQDPMVEAAVIPRGGGGVSHPGEMQFSDDGTLYYCASPGGLNIVDVSNASSPSSVASLRPNNRRKCQHLSFDATRMYATSRGDESDPPFVAAFDMTQNPPSQLPAFTRQDLSYEGVAADGNIAYVAVHDDGLLVLDWSTGSPIEIANLSTGFDNAWAVALTGSTLIVADAGFGVVTVDVTTPSNPQIRGSVALPTGSAQAIATDGTYAYVAMGPGGLAVVDVSTATAPTLVSTKDTPGSASDLQLFDGKLAVADWNDFRVYDVSDPAGPELISSQMIAADRNFTRFLGAAAFGDTVVAGEFNGTVYVYTLFPERLAPEIRTASNSVTFARTDPGDADALALIIENEGPVDLVISDIAISGSVFTAVDTSMFIPAGGAEVLEVEYHPESGNQDVGTVTFTSDDPDETALVVDLTGNAPTLVAGDPMPEVELSLLGGGSWRLSEQQGQVVVLAYFATF